MDISKKWNKSKIAFKLTLTVPNRRSRHPEFKSGIETQPNGPKRAHKSKLRTQKLIKQNLKKSIKNYKNWDIHLYCMVWIWFWNVWIWFWCVMDIVYVVDGHQDSWLARAARALRRAHMYTCIYIYICVCIYIYIEIYILFFEIIEQKIKLNWIRKLLE